MNSVPFRRVRPDSGRRGTGAVDWIVRGLACAVLVSTTACAGPGAAPASTVGSPLASDAAPAAAPTTPDDMPLDPETGPASAPAGTDAPRAQPPYASKALDAARQGPGSQDGVLP